MWNLKVKSVEVDYVSYIQNACFIVHLRSASLILGPLVVNGYETSFLSNLGMIQKWDNLFNSSILSF